tara:strand:- start:1186 stop:1551 length:366 start_codon:yes stop_codon:yes gene_type:complete
MVEKLTKEEKMVNTTSEEIRKNLVKLDGRINEKDIEIIFSSNHEFLKVKIDNQEIDLQKAWSREELPGIGAGIPWRKEFKIIANCFARLLEESELENHYLDKCAREHIASEILHDRYNDSI